MQSVVYRDQYFAVSNIKDNISFNWCSPVKWDVTYFDSKRNEAKVIWPKTTVNYEMTGAVLGNQDNVSKLLFSVNGANEDNLVKYFTQKKGPNPSTLAEMYDYSVSKYDPIFSANNP